MSTQTNTVGGRVIDLTYIQLSSSNFEEGETMNRPRQNFDAYVFSKQPGYHEPTVR